MLSGAVYALTGDAASGIQPRLVFSRAAAMKYSAGHTPMAVSPDAGKIYYGDETGNMYCLDKTGRQLWRFHASVAKDRWAGCRNFKQEDIPPILISQILASKDESGVMVLIGPGQDRTFPDGCSYPLRVVRLSAEGAVMWEREIGIEGLTMAASDNGDRTLLIPWAREHDWSKSAGNYVLLGADGRTLWTAAPDKYMNDKPSGPDDYYTETPSGEISGVYIFAGNKLLDRFGKPIWVLPKNEFFSGVSKEFAAVSHFDKTTSCLKIFDMRTRKVLWQTRPENYEMPLDFGGSSVQFHNGVMEYDGKYLNPKNGHPIKNADAGQTVRNHYSIKWKSDGLALIDIRTNKTQWNLSGVTVGDSSSDHRYILVSTDKEIQLYALW